jgi:hypothetical protein
VYYFKANGRFEKLWIGLEGRPAGGNVFATTVAEIVRAHWGDGLAQQFLEMTNLFRAP